MAATRFNRISVKLPLVVAVTAVTVGIAIAAILVPIVHEAGHRTAREELAASPDKNRAQIEELFRQLEVQAIDGAKRMQVKSALAAQCYSDA